MTQDTPSRDERSGLGFPRQEDAATKRARVLAELDLERQRRPERFVAGSVEPDTIEVRLERLEAAVYSLFSRLDAAA